MKLLKITIIIFLGIWLVTQSCLVDILYAEADNRQIEVALKNMITSNSDTSYTCYLEAPGYDVQVRVYSVNDYREREDVIWSGLIQANQQQLITSKREVVLYNFRKAPKGQYGGDKQISCSGGGVIRLIQ
jgi:hypothetical protein